MTGRNFVARAAGAALAAFTLVATAEAGTINLADYSSFVGFGDSTADSGNANLFAGATPPAGGYVNGAFTNGPNYFDQLSNLITGGAGGAPGNFLGGSNYAFGGAQAQTVPGGVPDFSDQVATYLADGVDTGALHAVNLGGNDAFGFIFGGLTDVTGYAAGFAAAFSAQIQTLIDAGVTDFLISSAPEVGGTPFVVNSVFGGDLGASLAFTDILTTALNDALFGSLATLAQQNPNANLFFFDVVEPFADVAADPAAFGLDPALSVTPCNDPAGNPDWQAAIASNCEGYIFIDNVHVTTTGQEVILDAALSANKIPAPGGLALFVVGVAAIGWARKRAL
ncbi:MAG: SGNH/GDSL hydrolase family protein [Pseudomonadota bacterium]